MTSAANPVVKRMRMLASRKFRQREGMSLAEGIQPVWQAVEAGAPVEALIFAPDLLRYQPAVEMVLEQERRGVRVVRRRRGGQGDGPLGQRLVGVVPAKGVDAALDVDAPPIRRAGVLQADDARNRLGGVGVLRLVLRELLPFLERFGLLLRLGVGFRGGAGFRGGVGYAGRGKVPRPQQALHWSLGDWRGEDV